MKLAIFFFFKKKKLLKFFNNKILFFKISYETYNYYKKKIEYDEK